MKRRFPVLGIALIIIGMAGLAWLSFFQGGPWFNAQWTMGPWGAGGSFMGPGMMPRFGPGMMGGWARGWSGKQSFTSNGEQIYYTGVSGRTGPVASSGGPMWMASGPIGCVACHGIRGRGGVPIMMGTVLPADIRYEALTKGEAHDGGEEARKHPPYTDALIRRAISQGLDPAGEPLDWTMPRWRMGDSDFADLLAYLRTLR